MNATVTPLPAPADPAAAPATPSPIDDAVAAFHAGDLTGAHAAFERAHRKDPRAPRLMSWYGVTLVMVEKNSNLGVVLCDQAVRAAGADVELLLNQARVHLALNQRERAVRSVARGLEAWPDDPRLHAARDALGTRREPVIGFLSRGHPLNRALGRLRHKWSRRNGPFYDLSPVTLGIPHPDAPPAPRS